MTDFEKWSLAVAVFGAFAALIMSGLSLYLQWREKKPFLKVQTNLEGYAFIVSSQDWKEKHIYRTFQVYISNVGEKPIAISELIMQIKPDIALSLSEFETVNDMNSVQYTGGAIIPFVAEPLRGYKFQVVGESLSKRLLHKGIKGRFTGKVLVRDELRRVYKSKSFKLKVESLIPITEII